MDVVLCVNQNKKLKIQKQYRSLFDKPLINNPRTFFNIEF